MTRFVVFLVFLTPLALRAAVGTTAFDFLTSPSNPRAAALGGGGSALGGETSLGSLNPAGWATLARGEAFFEGHQGVEGLANQSLGIGWPTPHRGVWTGRITTLDHGDIPATDAGGVPIGDVQARSLWLQAGWAGRALSERTWWGLSANLAQEQLAGESAQGVFLDVGLLHKLPPVRAIPNGRVGFSLLRVGPGVQQGSDRVSLPRELRWGAAALWSQDRVIFTQDIVARKNQRLGFSTGLEVNINGAAFFRLGHDSSLSSDHRWSYGLGVRVWSLDFNYTLSPSADLGDAHRLGLTVRFGQAVENNFALGTQAFHQQDYPLAVLYFGRVLAADPKNAEALRLLRDAAAKIEVP